MNKKTLHKVLSILLSLYIMIANSHATEFTTKETISEGLDYSRSIITTDEGNNQRVFVLEYDLDSQTEMRFTYGKAIFGASTLKNMLDIENMALENGGKIVGAINCDFFSTKTGVPMSAMIADGEIISSDDSKPVLAITNDNTAFIGFPSISARISRDDTAFEIGHINKFPTPYSLYLLTDKFSNTTHSEYPSTEIVLMPVNESYSQEVYLNEYNKFVESQSIVDAKFSATDATNDASNEKQEENAVESIETQTENEATFEFDFSNYFENKALLLNASFDVVVADVRLSSTNSDIPQGCFVLCADDRPYKQILENVKVGEIYTLTTESDISFDNVKNAIGGGSVIISGGEAVNQPTDYLFMSRHPRSAVGIKQDGTLVFIAVDGRKTGYSDGMNIDELTKKMLELGCYHAMNLDGGGSTVMYSALPTKENVRQNIPSDGGERPISNAAVFVNNTVSDGVISGFYAENEDYYLLGGGSSVMLPSEILAHDNAFNLASAIPSNECYFTTSDSSIAYINEEGRLVSGNYDGECDVICEYDGLRDVVFSAHITNALDNFVAESSSSEIEHGKPVKLSASATKNSLEVKMDLDKLVFSFAEDENEAVFFLPYEGEFGAISEEGIFEISEDYKNDSITLNVDAGHSSTSLTLSVKRVEKLFADMDNHWAKDISALAFEKGIIEGIIDEHGNRYFRPDGNINAAQICAIMSRYMNILPDESYSPPENLDFEIITNDSTRWALPYLYKLASFGLLNPLVETVDGKRVFDSVKEIKRIDALRLLGYICDNTQQNCITDYNDMTVFENDPYLFNINKTLASGIFSGFPDKTMKPDNSLTRAETATVFLRLYSKLESV